MSRLRKQAHEPFLLEMFVSGDRFEHSAFTHNDKTHRIAKGIIFVQAVFDESHGFLVRSFFNPYQRQARQQYQVRPKANLSDEAFDS